jgi:hypothetical protein
MAESFLAGGAILFFQESFCGRAEKFTGIGGFNFWHLNEYATGGNGVVYLKSRGFVHDDGVESSRFEPGALHLRFG